MRPPFETYFFQFHALFTWKQDVRPPICDKTVPPQLENPGSATAKEPSNLANEPNLEQIVYDI